MDSNTTCFLDGGIGISIFAFTILIPIAFFMCGALAYIFIHKFSTKCGAVFAFLVSIVLGGMEMFQNKHFIHGIIALIPIAICIIICYFIRDKIKDFFEDGGNDNFEEKITEQIHDFIEGFKQGIRKE